MAVAENTSFTLEQSAFIYNIVLCRRESFEGKVEPEFVSTASRSSSGRIGKAISKDRLLKYWIALSLEMHLRFNSIAAQNASATCHCVFDVEEWPGDNPEWEFGYN